MAAGIIYQTVTTTLGETVELAFYVDDTVTPTQWTPVRRVDPSQFAFNSGNVGATTFRVVNATDDPALAAIVTAINNSAVGKAEDAASASADTGVGLLAVRKATPANTSDTDGDYEFVQMSAGHVWVAPPPLTKVSANFTAAGTTPSYISGEWISDNATAGSVTKLSWSIGRSAGIIRRVRIRKSDQTVATPTIRLWLWDATFTVAVGNDAAGAQPLQDAIGYVDVPVTSAGSDDAVGWANCDIPFSAATVFGLIQSLSTFTGATSEVWTIDLWYLPG